jgi:hypothetical protein
LARKKHLPISEEDRRTVGLMLRDLRRGAGYRSVDAAAATRGCPAARQTIYAYERGGLTPSLQQFLELVEFYVLGTDGRPEAISPNELRTLGVAAVARALELPAYHVAEARDLIHRMGPRASRG